jgi:hypothetical protein
MQQTTLMTKEKDGDKAELIVCFPLIHVQQNKLQELLFFDLQEKCYVELVTLFKISCCVRFFLPRLIH